MMFPTPFRLAPVLAAMLVAAGAGMGSGAVGAAERTSRPRLCPEDAPEGVRLPTQAGCGTTGRRDDAQDARAFRDLGGVQLRVGGRVGVGYGIGR